MRTVNEGECETSHGLPGNLSPQRRRGFGVEPLTELGQPLYSRVHVFWDSVSKKGLHLSLWVSRNAAIKLGQDSVFVQDLHIG